MNELRALWERIRHQVRDPYCGESAKEMAAGLLFGAGILRTPEEAVAYALSRIQPGRHEPYWQEVADIIQQAR